jgi:hypothetical protein
LFAATDDPKVRPALALVLGSLRPDATVTGSRLQRYAPPKPAAPEAPKEGEPVKEKPAPKEKETDKEKEIDKDK